jgi:hypothetical protein
LPRVACGGGNIRLQAELALWKRRHALLVELLEQAPETYDGGEPIMAAQSRYDPHVELFAGALLEDRDAVLADMADFCYVLGHQDLLTTAITFRGPVVIQTYRDHIHQWARDYHRQWPCLRRTRPL